MASLLELEAALGRTDAVMEPRVERTLREYVAAAGAKHTRVLDLLADAGGFRAAGAHEEAVAEAAETVNIRNTWEMGQRTLPERSAMHGWKEDPAYAKYVDFTTNHGKKKFHQRFPISRLR